MSKSPSPADEEVGRRIRFHRRAKKVGKLHLAQQLGISPQQLQKYESGINRITAGKLVEIANVLDIEMSDFFDRPSDSAPSNDNRLHPQQFDFTHEALLMSVAFMQIADPNLRRRLLELVQSVGESDGQTNLTNAYVGNQTGE